MWEAIEHVLLSPNVTVILLFFAFVVIIAVGLSKTGILNIHTQNIQIGAADKERDIIRQQIEWIRLHCEGAEATLEKPEGYNEWLGKYIAERVYDEYVDWITFNHINASPAYIEIKQDKIINIIHKFAIKDEFRSPEFDEKLKEDIKFTIEKLIQIRKMYSSNNI